jgi:hypothetical protein
MRRVLVVIVALFGLTVASASAANLDIVSGSGVAEQIDNPPVTFIPAPTMPGTTSPTTSLP